MAPMAVLSSVLRVLSDFGDAAGWLIAALVLFAYGRRIIQENEKAHAAITEKLQALDTKIDTVAQALGAIARDVSFLAGTAGYRHSTTARGAGIASTAPCAAALRKSVFGLGGLAAVSSQQQSSRCLDVSLGGAAGEELRSLHRRDLLGNRRRHELIDACAVGLTDPSAARSVLAGVATGVPKSADGAAEMVLRIKIARDTAIKARSAAMATLKTLPVGTMACGDAEIFWLGGDATRLQPGGGHRPVIAGSFTGASAAAPCQELCKAVPIAEEFQTMPGAGEPGPALPEFGIGEKDFVLSWACRVDGRLERGAVLPHRERFAFDECEGLFEEQSVDGFVDPLAAFYRAERRVVTPHPVQGAVGVGELVTAEAGERAGQLPELVADAESEGDAELVVVHQPVVRGAGDGSLSEQGRR